VKTETFQGVIESAYGKPVSEYGKQPIAFNGSFEAYEKHEEIHPSELPNNDDVLSWVNNKRKASKRQSAMTAALDAAGIVKPTLATDPGLQLKQMVEVYVARGKSPEVALELAKAALEA
jgi:hypothetical protein